MVTGLGNERVGAVTLARHGKPALSRRTLLSADEYSAWWAAYEVGGLRPDQSVPPSLQALALAAGAVVASTRRRSIETAKAVTGGDAFIADAMFIEAPLPPPPLPNWIKLPPMAWGFVSRTTWWFLNLHRGEESRRDAEARAEAAATRLITIASGGDDVLVLAHGFFNTMVARVLRRRGWRCVDDGGWRYWSARRFERRV